MERILRQRAYHKADMEEMARHMDNLEREYNTLRHSGSPMIMDSLLEVIEQLKQTRKNYEEDIDTYAFDYKDFFNKTVQNREKVYQLYNLQKDGDVDSDDEEQKE